MQKRIRQGRLSWAERLKEIFLSSPASIGIHSLDSGHTSIRKASKPRFSSVWYSKAVCKWNYRQYFPESEIVCHQLGTSSFPCSAATLSNLSYMCKGTGSYQHWVERKGSAPEVLRDMREDDFFISLLNGVLFCLWASIYVRYVRTVKDFA